VISKVPLNVEFRVGDQRILLTLIEICFANCLS